MVSVLVCVKGKTDLLSSLHAVNIYTTLVFDPTGYVCCVLQRSEVTNNCPLEGEIRYNWSGFKSFPKGPAVGPTLVKMPSDPRQAFLSRGHTLSA